MTVQERIEAAKTKLEEAERAKTRAEAQLEAATKQCQDVVKEMEQYGVTPDTIEEEIKRLTAEVEDNLKIVEEAIPVLD